MALKRLGLGGDVGRVTESAHCSEQGNDDDAVSGPYVGDLLLRAIAGTAQKAVVHALIIAAVRFSSFATSLSKYGSLLALKEVYRAMFSLRYTGMSLQ